MLWLLANSKLYRENALADLSNRVEVMFTGAIFRIKKYQRLNEYIGYDRVEEGITSFLKSRIDQLSSFHTQIMEEFNSPNRMSEDRIRKEINL